MNASIVGVYMDGTVGTTVQKAWAMAIARGEGATIDVVVKLPDASIVDITGKPISARIERRDGSTLVKRFGVMQSGPAGTTRLTLLSAETILWAPQVAAWSFWITIGTEDYPLSLRSDFFIEDRTIDPGAGTFPGPDMILVGVPVPGSGDVNKVLSVASLSPLAFAWVANSGSGGGSAVVNTAPQAADYTAARNQRVLCNASLGDFNVTLPASPASNDLVQVANIAASGVVTVLPASIELVGGDATHQLDAWESATFVFDGTNWMVI